MSKLFIHATNIHRGGGAELLTALLKNLPRKTEIILLYDSRMVLPQYIKHINKVKPVKASVIARFCAELWLAKNVASHDVVLCFGNLPPLFKLLGYTVVFVQNRYLIDKTKLNGFSLKAQLRLLLESFWLSSKMSNANQLVVQTPTMKKLLEIKTQGTMPVQLLPFMSEVNGYDRVLFQPNNHKKVEFDFVYVASGEPHKNHERLLEAWCLLAEEGLYPSLCITLNTDFFVTLCKKIEVMSQQFGLRLVNVGECSHEDVLILYGKSQALIYPSVFESFGLPLIEARQAGLPVIASELDYVRDVLDPEQTFNPLSPESIAKSIKRFMGKTERKLPLLDASEFIGEIINLKGNE